MSVAIEGKVTYMHQCWTDRAIDGTAHGAPLQHVVPQTETMAAFANAPLLHFSYCCMPANYSVTLYVHGAVCRATWSRSHCIPYSPSTMGVSLRPTCWSNSSRGRRQFLGIRQVPVSNFRVAYCFQVGFRNPTTMSVREPCSLHPVC